MSRFDDMLPVRSKVETIIKIVPSTKKLKKYDAHIKNLETGRMRVVSFGQKYEDGTPFVQYKDKLGHYSKYDHNDPERRKRYLDRHRKQKDLDEKGRYTANLFAKFFLW